MEIILTGLIQQLMPVIGVALTGLVGWGIALLKKKTEADVAKNALDQVDQVVKTVVGGLAQTVANDLKAASENGKLSATDKAALKTNAINQTKLLLSDAVVTAARRTVDDLSGYISQKIETQVLALKK